MAYTDVPDSDIDVDSPLDTDLFTALRDNDNETRQILFGYNRAEVTTTTSGYTTLATFSLYLEDLPDYTGIQRKLVMPIELKQSGGGTVTFRLQDNAAAVESNEVTETSATYVWSADLTLNFAAGLEGTTRTINLQAKVTSGDAFARSQNRAAVRVHY